MTSYGLTTHYAGESLISGFNFLSIADPTNGFIAYQEYDQAVSQGLVSVDATTDAVTLSVDTTNTYNPDGSEGGRPSVRLESKVAVNQGLVIGDFAHMPGSVCGSWPAFWLYGPNWPNSGEIDIIEGANTAYTNLISAHTGPNCNLPETGVFTGSQQLVNCTSPNDANGYSGCNYLPPTSDMSSYGDNFNAVGGGVYAMDWTSEAIRIWHFPRGSIPQDIVDKAPDPSTWGAPQALFGGGTGTLSCDVETSFSNMNIVINLDLCGSYAGNLWGVNNQCDDYAATCEDWVGNNPSQLTNVFWEINYIDVYTLGATNTAETSTSFIRSTTTVPTTPYPTGSNSTRTTSIAISSPLIPAFSSVTFPTIVGSASVTRSVSSLPSPTDSMVPIHDPATIGTFALLGCFSSSTGYSTFNETAESERMTPEVCVGLCSTSQYAGVYDTNCYCADVLDAGTSALPDRDSCDTPCPGNSDEFCGGIIATTGAVVKKRDAPSNILLTVYGNMALAVSDETVPQPAPGLGGSSPSDYNATVTQTITSTITYTTVCSTDAAKLVTSEYCTTLTITSCPGDYSPGRVTKAAPKYSPGPVSETGPKYGSDTVYTVNKAATGYQPSSMHKAAATGHSSASPVTKAATQANSPQSTEESDAQSDVPMTTMTQTCDKCGANGESTVTLTMPLDLVIDMTKVGHSPVATGQNNASSPMGMMPVQAGASRSSGWSAVLMFGIALAGALLV
ncbi:hypothetical protein VMCG_02639 [Cytospora schulzeri]|uniref:GH16 domain-containing protein n=1 Tax=Cytospora schulzeri TaxID=448051 RepID=A0A423X112_9PEZI|nr:hypothetical protein VMCG_02639 [Valsa malicola]